MSGAAAPAKPAPITTNGPVVRLIAEITFPAVDCLQSADLLDLNSAIRQGLPKIIFGARFMIRYFSGSDQTEAAVPEATGAAYEFVQGVLNISLVCQQLGLKYSVSLGQFLVYLSSAPKDRWYLAPEGDFVLTAHWDGMALFIDVYDRDQPWQPGWILVSPLADI